MLREVHWLSVGQGQCQSRVCEKHMAKIQGQMDFNTETGMLQSRFTHRSQHSCSAALCFVPLSAYSYYVTSLSSQGEREGRSPVTSCTSCTHQEMWLSRSPFALTECLMCSPLPRRTL